MKIACIQMDIAYGDPVLNKQNLQEEMKNIHKENVDVVVLPELWTTGYDLSRLKEIGDEEGRDSKQFLSELAQKYNVNLVAGSIAKVVEDKSYNTMYVFNRQGELLSEYSKAHLFRLMDEHLYLASGDTTGNFSLEGIPSSGLICYDIRFPEWVRTHTAEGSHLVYVVAEWPLARISHWKSLLISRAIENQCFVVACNRSGSDPKTEFGGHSIIISPWGDIISEAGTDATILYGKLDLNIVKSIREHIPIFQDRRTDLYK